MPAGCSDVLQNKATSNHGTLPIGREGIQNVELQSSHHVSWSHGGGMCQQTCGAQGMGPEPPINCLGDV